MKSSDQIREELKDNVGKKFLTSLINSLSQFEMAYGYLWGIGRNTDELTPDEQSFRILWEITRKNILDTGHKQRKNAFAELDMYDYTPRVYHATFIVNQPDDNIGNH
jgi:hypothetical protein